MLNLTNAFTVLGSMAVVSSFVVCAVEDKELILILMLVALAGFIAFTLFMCAFA